MVLLRIRSWALTPAQVLVTLQGIKLCSMFPAILVNKKARPFLPDKFSQNSEAELKRRKQLWHFLFSFENNDSEEKTELQVAGLY